MDCVSTIEVGVARGASVLAEVGYAVRVGIKVVVGRGTRVGVRTAVESAIGAAVPQADKVVSNAIIAGTSHLFFIVPATSIFYEDDSPSQ